MKKLHNNMLLEKQQKDQPTWYETSLPLMERKKRGHFSTPSTLVEKILDACSSTSDTDLAQKRVLDPACGSGNFLVGAARRLLDFRIRTNLSLQQCASLIQRNLWGIDPDPISCFLAEMHLRTTIHSGVFSAFPLISLNIRQADSLVLPWEPTVDLLIANPPYLAAKNNDLSGYYVAHQRGQSDSYLLFLNLALQVVRPGGWIGLVLPDPILARANAAKERARVLEEATIHHLWHFSDVFAADVGAVVIIAQKAPPKFVHYISWIRGRWQSDSSFDSQHQVQQTLFSRQPGAEFRYLLSQDRGAALERLRASLEEKPTTERHLAPLSEFLTISRGEELGRASPSIQTIPTALVNTKYSMDGACSDHDDTTALPTAYPVLRGGIDIHPYTQPTTNSLIAQTAITKPLERYLTPKLLVVKSTDRLQAVLDQRGHIVLQTLYVLHHRNQQARPDQLYFFLALLNSRLLREYVYVLHTAYKWVQPQIEQRVLASLPVPLVKPSDQQEIIERAKALEHACSGLHPVVEWDKDITGLYEEQESAICSLYESALAEFFTDKGVIKMADTRPIRVLVAKPGLDGHDRGAKVIARALRDAGMEVIYTGIRQTPEMIVEAAIQEDVDAILMSILSGAHMAIFPKVMDLLKQNGVDDVLVAAGGILPDEDLPVIKAMGIKGCFGPGTSTDEIIEFVRANVQADRLTADV